MDHFTLFNLLKIHALVEQIVWQLESVYFQQFEVSSCNCTIASAYIWISPVCRAFPFFGKCTNDLIQVDLGNRILDRRTVLSQSLIGSPIAQ